MTSVCPEVSIIPHPVTAINRFAQQINRQPKKDQYEVSPISPLTRPQVICSSSAKLQPKPDAYAPPQPIPYRSGQCSIDQHDDIFIQPHRRHPADGITGDLTRAASAPDLAAQPQTSGIAPVRQRRSPLISTASGITSPARGPFWDIFKDQRLDDRFHRNSREAAASSALRAVAANALSLSAMPCCANTAATCRVAAVSGAALIGAGQ